MDNYCSLFSLLLLLLNSITLCLCTPSATDKQALVAFKTSIISDPRAILSKNWSDDTPVCDWVGVSCGMRHHRVTALNLSAFHLAGTLSPHLGNLTFLTYFDISFNSFTGFLPSELSNLHRLKVMNAMVNELTGEIPKWLGSLPQLQQLLLSNNSFSGRISPSLFNNSKLQILRMSFNRLSGNIPEEIGNTSSLQILRMSYNQLSGFIPRGIFNISSMREIIIENNSLRGSLPSDHVWNNIPNLQTLDLLRNQLSGEIPPNICKCTHLELLALSINHFSGNIPHEIGSLSALKELYLGINHFRGILTPAIGNLSRLQLLSIKDTSLTGSIPSSIFNISSLRVLSLSNNSFSGSIPTFRNLPQLELLYLDYNKLTGWLPSDMYDNMPNIKTLSLHFNQLGGKIPPNLWKCRYLENLSLSGNNFRGSIPCEIGNMSMLTELYLGVNNFQGGVPAEIGNLSRLEVLSITGASLTGSIPSSIFSISSLTFLSLSNNSLSGSIPTSSNLPQLQTLYLYNNKLTGEIPSSICNLKSLKHLSLLNNSLDGSIPQCLGDLIPTKSEIGCSLESLRLSGNKLEGKLPRSLLNCENLKVVDAGNNRIQDKFPSWMETLPQLRVLILRANMFNGTVLSTSRTKLPFSKLQVFDISKNGFTGSLNTVYLKSLQDMVYGKKHGAEENIAFLDDEIFFTVTLKGLELPFERFLPTFTMIDWSSNRFSGPIPNSIGNLISLMHLNLSHNCLTGHIPASLGNVTLLESLDLSSNNLSGKIPTELAKLTFLAKLNLSMNNLSGQIPQSGQLSTFDNSSYIGNSGLCGLPLAKECEVPSPFLVNDGGSRPKTFPLEKYIVPTFISVIIFVIIVLVLIKRIKKKKVQQCGDVSLLEYRRISVIELERGTSSFSETNLLGRGSFGSVFEATLCDGLKVAVKVFNLQWERAVESFHTETEILSSIRHRNLVRVIGCCTNTEFKALILEHMPNGSLEKWLYSENSCLGLLQRLKVAMDVALAVEYLHHGYTVTIVHCDIKPSNVLLDEDMNARVCEFGISKLFDEGESLVHTKTLATIGYAAPEYGSEGKVSTNGDVYSYGILLLEIFTGKKPTDEMFSEEMSLKEWVSRAIQNDGSSEVVVPGLVYQGDGNYNEKVNCVSSIFELAMKCLAFSAEERINMRQIVAALHKINAQLLATNQMHLK